MAGAGTADASTAAQRRGDPIRVVLADDHPALRLGLRVLLDQETDVTVVGEAGDGSAALEQIATLQPTVAVVDCRLPRLAGPAVAAELRRRHVPTRVLALSAYRDDAYVRGMVEAGAAGYLLKDEAPGVIAAAVRAVARGEGWFSPSVASLLADDIRARGASAPRLTERERVALGLVGQGKTNKEIAVALRVTERTVEFHLGNARLKIGAGSRVEAALWAKEHGLSQ